MDYNNRSEDLKSPKTLDMNDNCRKDESSHPERRICCVGMCVLDIIHVCANYPVEDTDKRCLKGYLQRGGNASNNCTILRELGYPCVEFLGMMSTAKGFDFLRSDCEQRGIIFSNCPTVDQDPPFSSVILVENTDSRTIVHSNSNFPILEQKHFVRICKDFDKYCWIHFEARNPEQTLAMQHHICEYNQRCGIEGKQQRIIISVEFEKVFEENLVLAANADYIFLGKDLAKHMGWLSPKEAVYGLRDWMRKNPESHNNHSFPAIICPWGATGASSLDKHDQYAFSPSKPSEKMVDALGAGDTFCAATIYAISALHMQLHEAVDFGNYCAGAKLGLYGYDGIAEKVQKIIRNLTT